MKRVLAEMTWPDVAQAVACGMTTVILPLGATEQHGPHLPLGTDTFRAEALAERLASALPDALVAPALPIGCSDEHSGFAGLLSLDHATLAGVIVHCARRCNWPPFVSPRNCEACRLRFLVLRRLRPMLCLPSRKPRVSRPKRWAYMPAMGRPRKCYACGLISCVWSALSRVTRVPWRKSCPGFCKPACARSRRPGRWVTRAARMAFGANGTWRSRLKVTGSD